MFGKCVNGVCFITSVCCEFDKSWFCVYTIVELSLWSEIVIFQLNLKCFSPTSVSKFNLASSQRPHLQRQLQYINLYLHFWYYSFKLVTHSINLKDLWACSYRKREVCCCAKIFVLLLFELDSFRCELSSNRLWID